MTDKDWHNYKSGQDELNEVKITGSQKGSGPMWSSIYATINMVFYEPS
jgi:hypothetical protein